MEYLACRNKWAGDILKLKIWRDGKVQDIDYKLPKADFSDNLVMDRPSDVEPTYLIAGGLVFVPLSAEFLSSWGATGSGAHHSGWSFTITKKRRRIRNHSWFSRWYCLIFTTLDTSNDPHKTSSSKKLTET